MSFSSGPTTGLAPRARNRRHRIRFSRIAFIVATLGLSAAAGFWAQKDAQPLVSAVRELAPMLEPVLVASSRRYDPLLDPGYSLGPAPLTLGGNSPLAASFQSALAPPDAPVEPPAPAVEPEIVAPVPQPQDAPKLAQMTPLPVPRPSELRLPADPEAPRVAERQATRRTRTAAVPPAPTAADNRSFFEKIFGVQRSSGPALAYAAPEDDVVDRSRGRRLSPTLPSSAGVSAQATAIYDISARMVYMPNGDRLEAHSGLGDKMDDPRFAHVRMQGVTPPHVYDLKEREALFHGVRAIRLHPVGGSGAIHGRAGLLAHTYLLGPRGDSNGCVSFRDYDKFLQAYLRGEVKRLVVVASM